MEIRQLKYFLAIFEEKHVGRAAKKCFVTQPALTQQIHKLEDELQISLLMPNGRGIAITEEGKRFIPYARTIIDSVDKAMHAFSSDSTIESGEVILGVSSRIHDLLLNILPSLHKLNIRIKKMGYEQMMHEIDSGVIGLGIMHSTHEDKYIEKRIILCEKMYFVVAESTLSITEDSSIKIKDVLKTPIVLLSDKVLPRTIFAKYIGKVHPVINLISELDSIDELAKVLKYSSIGTILPSSQLPKNMHGLKSMEILGNPINYELSLIWNKGFSDIKRINSFVSVLSQINYLKHGPEFFIPASPLPN
jgi:DNA-binding transcriptional LysR family regulator